MHNYYWFLWKSFLWCLCVLIHLSSQIPASPLLPPIVNMKNEKCGLTNREYGKLSMDCSRHWCLPLVGLVLLLMCATKDLPPCCQQNGICLTPVHYPGFDVYFHSLCSSIQCIRATRWLSTPLKHPCHLTAYYEAGITNHNLWTSCKPCTLDCTPHYYYLLTEMKLFCLFCFIDYYISPPPSQKIMFKSKKKQKTEHRHSCMLIVHVCYVCACSDSLRVFLPSPATTYMYTHHRNDIHLDEYMYVEMFWQVTLMFTSGCEGGTVALNEILGVCPIFISLKMNKWTNECKAWFGAASIASIMWKSFLLVKFYSWCQHFLTIWLVGCWLMPVT